MTREEYLAKLRDPRWQKKRLEILNRDRFFCQMCGDEKNTLHVHHRYYKNSDPWDYPNDSLVALCESCHEFETENRGAFDDLIKIIKMGFFSADAERLSGAFLNLKTTYPSDVTAMVIEYALSEKILPALTKAMFKELHIKLKKKKDG